MKAANRKTALAQVAADGDVKQVLSKLADVLNEDAADDTELAGHCADFAKTLDSTRKAMGFGDDDELEPPPISRVTGDVPPAGLRPVFRSGQRDFAAFAPLDKSNLANETIKKITSLD